MKKLSAEYFCSTDNYFIAQWVIVDKVVQFRLLRHGHIQCILNPGTVNENFSPIPEQQFHAADIHVIRCYYERGIVG